MPWYFNSTTIKGALLAVLPTVILVLKALGVEVLEGELEKVIDGLAGLAGMASVVVVILERVKNQHILGAGTAIRHCMNCPCDRR